MLQRGRKSVANLAASSVNGKPRRLAAPSSLMTEEKALFSELIGACDSTHFRASDLPLLVSYIQATLIAQAAAHDPDRIMLWEKAVRMQATLATSLRLAPQSRVDPKSLGRQDHHPRLRYPWEDNESYERAKEGDE
jgi:hypothetical protein